jgi:DUF4097 and DUF4098 domain-containing protein YvlB
MKTRALIVSIVLSSAVAASAQQPQLRKVLRSEQKFTIAPTGSFILENPVGGVEVVGADVTDVEATITTVIRGADAASIQEARKESGLLIGGDLNARIVRTAVAANYEKKSWSATVDWKVRVPRSASVRVLSNGNSRIKVTGVKGNLHVKNFNGNVSVANVLGSTLVESVNGSITYSTPQPRGNVILSTVNGYITATLDADKDFRWIAETATGDIRTNLPARGAFFGSTFRGAVNTPGGPTLTTRSLMGNISLLGSGPHSAPMRSLREIPAITIANSPARASQDSMTSSSGPRVLRLGSVNGFFAYETNLGDVKIAEIKGDADISTGAGEIQIGTVGGSAKLRSFGGPLQLGEVAGPVTASTRAGDIVVDAMRRGGTLSTQGGTIRILFAGGPARLTSGGGDIIVRQAAASVTATTTSGDVSITVDPASASETIEARTGKGNVILNVTPGFKADVDATIITSDPNADTIVSDIPGLSITREQVSGKTRVRAVGKLNGGGNKIVLYSTGGDIRILTGTNLRPR